MWLPFSYAAMTGDQSLWSLAWLKPAADISLENDAARGTGHSQLAPEASQTKRMERNFVKDISILTIEFLLLKVQGSFQWLFYS